MSSFVYEDFRNVSFDKLIAQANEYMFQYGCVNRPRLARGFGVLPYDSTSCVVAQPDGALAFNFASKAVQAMMLQEVPNAEGIIDEIGSRMDLSREEVTQAIHACARLGVEVVTFLDSLRGEGPLNSGEIRDFAIESVKPFFARPAPVR